MTVVYVAALTFKRPEMLRKLLESLRSLEVPEDTEVRFLIVDNDPEASARRSVEAFVPRFDGRRLTYLVEPEPGIPAGRRRALREAIDGGGDLLCFVDDDAYPDRAWLNAMLGCRRASGAVLLFGPVRYVPAGDIDGPWRKLLASSLVARAAFIERYCAKHGRRGRVITSGTGNWMGDLEWIERHGLDFVPEYAGGGEDTAFREAVREQGGRMAWCEHALVHEQLPRERVSVRYQFRRARAHGMNAELLGRQPHLLILRNPFGRIMAGAGLMVFPVLGLASFMLGLHMLGMGIGILQARLGAKSGLYAR